MAKVASTASAELRKRTTAKTKSIGKTSQPRPWATPAPARQNGTRTLASMPAAMPSGISANALSKVVTAPVKAVNKPATTTAPTACCMFRPTVAAIRAAPGVDHARTTGTRAKS